MLLFSVSFVCRNALSDTSWSSLRFPLFFLLCRIWSLLTELRILLKCPDKCWIWRHWLPVKLCECKFWIVWVVLLRSTNTWLLDDESLCVFARSGPRKTVGGRGPAWKVISMTESLAEDSLTGVVKQVQSIGAIAVKRSLNKLIEPLIASNKALLTSSWWSIFESRKMKQSLNRSRCRSAPSQCAHSSPQCNLRRECPFNLVTAAKWISESHVSAAVANFLLQVASCEAVKLAIYFAILPPNFQILLAEF